METDPRHPFPSPRSCARESGAQGNGWATSWGQVPRPLASGEQDTLNEYHAKIIMHGGQTVAFQRKIEMLFPKEEVDAGQAGTADVPCSRPAWRFSDEPNAQKPCKEGRACARALTRPRVGSSGNAAADVTRAALL